MTERLKTGREIGHWRVEGYLGYGQSGEVYKVRETIEPHRLGALKIRRGCHVRVSTEEFLSEIKYLRSLNTKYTKDPATPRFYECGNLDGVTFFVMEFLRPIKPLHSAGTFIDLAKGLTIALEKLHDRGIIHCDIKPTNIARRGKKICLLDFGSACSLDTPKVSHIRIGTDRYMAPETNTNGLVSSLSDIYSAGATLDELCPKALHRIFDPVLTHAMASDPQKRIQSLAEFRHDIVTAIPDFRAHAARVTRLPRYRTMAKIVLGILAMALLAAGGIYSISRYRDYQQRKAKIVHKFDKVIDTRAQIATGLIYYQMCEFPKALWHLEKGVQSPDFNPLDFKGVDVTGIYNDCRRRVLLQRQPWEVNESNQSIKAQSLDRWNWSNFRY